MTTDPPRYTAEVEAAMRAQGLIIEPVKQVIPHGHLRFHIAVEQTVSTGTAPASVIAANLRALAEQLSPTPTEKEHHHG